MFLNNAEYEGAPNNTPWSPIHPRTAHLKEDRNHKNWRDGRRSHSLSHRWVDSWTPFPVFTGGLLPCRTWNPCSSKGSRWSRENTDPEWMVPALQMGKADLCSDPRRAWRMDMSSATLQFFKGQWQPWIRSILLYDFSWGNVSKCLYLPPERALKTDQRKDLESSLMNRWVYWGDGQAHGWEVI